MQPEKETFSTPTIKRNTEPVGTKGFRKYAEATMNAVSKLVIKRFINSVST